MDKEKFLDIINNMRQHNMPPYEVTLKGIVTGCSIGKDKDGNEEIKAQVDVIVSKKDNVIEFQGVEIDISQLK